MQSEDDRALRADNVAEEKPLGIICVQGHDMVFYFFSRVFTSFVPVLSALGFVNEWCCLFAA